jgi:hypothetical protein
VHHDIGVLDDPTSSPEERDRIVAHLRECLPCSKELVATLATIADLRATAALPFPEASELPPLRALRSVSHLGNPGPAARPDAGSNATLRRLPGRARQAGPRIAGASAAAVLLLGGGWAAGHATRGTTSPPLPAAAAPVTATVALAGATASGQASMTGHGDGQVMHIRLHGLPEPGPGRFYTVSLLPRSGPALTLGVLVGDSGDYALPARLVSNFVEIDIDVTATAGTAPVNLARGSLA